MELPEAAAGVIEHAVRHNANVARVRGVDEFTESRIAAQQRIDVEVIVSVIAVIRRRRKNRIEVDGGNAQVLQVIQMRGYAEQIAALETVSRRWRVPRLKIQARF